MKKLIYHLLLALLPVALLTACSDDDNDAPQLPDPNATSITLTRGANTSTTLTFTVEPSNEEQTYLCLYVDRKVIERVQRPFLADYLMYDLKRQAEEKGTPFEEYLADILQKGTQTLEATHLVPGGLYEVVAFPVSGIRAADQATCLYMQTRLADMTGCTFTLNVKEQGTDYVAFDLVPSDESLRYYFTTLYQENYDNYLQNYSKPGLLMAIFNEDYTQRLLALADPWGYVTQEDIDQVISEIFFQGTIGLKVQGVQPNSTLAWMAASFAVVETDEGSKIVMTSEVSDGTYSTLPAEAESSAVGHDAVATAPAGTSSWSFRASAASTAEQLLIAPWQKSLPVAVPITKRVR